MIAQDSVDATVFAAFAVGFISFISPCVLPLVPGYLSTISGVSFADIQEGKGRMRVLGPAILFCLAFTAMFVALGMTATGLGQTLQDNRNLLRQISGLVIGLLGVLFIATLFVPKLNREWRPEELMRRAHTGGPIIAGLAFAVAWLPCTGPTLGAILTAASSESTVGKGGVLLAFYALGLASEAPQAQRERAYIERLIRECRSKDQVKQALVAEYGENVLALPGDQGDDDLGDVLVYVVPALGILLAAGGIAFAVVRWRRRDGGPGGRGTALAGADGSRLDDDMDRYDL